jgi:hypothetical protein
MTEIAERPEIPIDFPIDEKIERGLLAVAAYSGNTRKASAFLKNTDGFDVPHQTLWRWARREHVERYEAIRAEVLPHVRAQAADEHMEIAEMQMEANRKIVTRLSANVDELPVKELPGASRNMSVGAAVETEKAQLLNDQPTQRVATDLPGLLKEIKSMGIDPKTVLEGQVVSEEDVPQAQIAEEDHKQPSGSGA